MAERIRAIYEDGRFRPLDPVGLAEGQEIQLALLTEREQIRMALADLLAVQAAPPVDRLDDQALAAQLDAEPAGTFRLSDAILEERWQGP